MGVVHAPYDDCYVSIVGSESRVELRPPHPQTQMHLRGPNRSLSTQKSCANRAKLRRAKLRRAQKPSKMPESACPRGYVHQPLPTSTLPPTAYCAAPPCNPRNGFPHGLNLSSQVQVHFPCMQWRPHPEIVEVTLVLQRSGHEAMQAERMPMQCVNSSGSDESGESGQSGQKRSKVARRIL